MKIFMFYRSNYVFRNVFLMVVFSENILALPYRRLMSEREIREADFLTSGDVRYIGDEKFRSMNDLAIKWPNGIVHYAYSESFQKDEYRVELIQEAIGVFHRFTCVTWLPRTDQEDYVNFDIEFNPTCWSFEGKIGGAQTLSIGPGCAQLGIVLHEMLHALGFVHEHIRPDRDKYIIVDFKNINGEFWESQYKVRGRVETYGTPYDYRSIMHYGDGQFQSYVKDNMKPIIVTKDLNAQDVIGQRLMLSRCDVVKINKAYQCEFQSAVLGIQCSPFTSDEDPLTMPSPETTTVTTTSTTTTTTRRPTTSLPRTTERRTTPPSITIPRTTPTIPWTRSTSTTTVVTVPPTRPPTTTPNTPSITPSTPAPPWSCRNKIDELTNDQSYCKLLLKSIKGVDACDVAKIRTLCSKACGLCPPWPYTTTFNYMLQENFL